MFAGHVGTALAIARAEPRVNAGLFVIAAVLLDVLLWTLVLLGWESVSIPSDMASTHQAQFSFPYSHGLLASVVWSLLAGIVTFGALSGLRTMTARAATLVALAVFSHWILDAIVHRPELPLAGPASPLAGLGLWNRLPIALAVESLLLLAGVALYLTGIRKIGLKHVGMTLVALLTLALTVLGMTVAPPPPSARAMAVSSLATLAVVCGAAFWFGRRTDGERLARQ